MFSSYLGRNLLKILLIYTSREGQSNNSKTKKLYEADKFFRNNYAFNVLHLLKKLPKDKGRVLHELNCIAYW